MDTSYIVKEVNQKYNYIKDVDRKAILSLLMKMDEKAAIASWDRIKFDYPDDYPTARKVKEFLGLDTSTGNALINLSNGARVCHKCKLVYASKSDRMSGVLHCPRCGDLNNSIIQDASQKKITFANDPCWRCAMFRSDERVRGLYGPECEHYGKGSQTHKECLTCACSQCCKAMLSVMERDTSDIRKEKQAKMDWRKTLDENLKEYERVKNTDYSEVRVKNIRKSKKEDSE